MLTSPRHSSDAHHARGLRWHRTAKQLMGRSPLQRRSTAAAPPGCLCMAEAHPDRDASPSCDHTRNGPSSSRTRCQSRVPGVRAPCRDRPLCCARMPRELYGHRSAYQPTRRRGALRPARCPHARRWSYPYPSRIPEHIRIFKNPPLPRSSRQAISPPKAAAAGAASNAVR